MPEEAWDKPRPAYSLETSKTFVRLATVRQLTHPLTDSNGLGQSDRVGDRDASRSPFLTRKCLRQRSVIMTTPTKPKGEINEENSQDRSINNYRSSGCGD